MAGSKKGERRGGRKPGMEPKPHPIRTRQKKPDPIGEAIEIAAKDKHINAPKRGRSVATEEYYRQLTSAMLPEHVREIEPREVMLEAMRYFHDGALSERRTLATLLGSLPDPAAAPQSYPWAEMDAQLAQAAGRAERLHTMAVDVAFKVAPYLHAKLSSVELKGGQGTQLSIIQVLMSEIADGARERPAWMDEVSEAPVIEHEAQIGEET